jgi:3-hydroxyisobutyrate dehydrogenase-like beta-hydroxyacid dehydrogenase
MNVGFIGLGRMGSLMARNLLNEGHTLFVHDIEPAAGKEIVDAGAIWASSAAEAARQAEVIVSSVPGPSEVAEVMNGSDGVLVGVRDGALVIETSTIGPEQSRKLAKRFEAKNASYVDATVNRIRLDGVARGQMTVMVGGSETDFERARPILTCLGNKIRHVGPVGSGNAVKLINQMIFLSYVAVFSEGLALGQRLGIELDMLLDVFSTSAAGHTMIIDKHDQIAAGDETPGFAISRVLKDLELAAELCSGEGFAAPSFAATLASFRHARSEGLGSSDMTALHRLFRDGHIA